MGHELLRKKQANVVELLSTEDVQNMITRPSNVAIAFIFPITKLLKRKKSQVTDSNAAFYTYSLDEAGFKDWHA